jgi:hypothetical protein
MNRLNKRVKTLERQIFVKPQKRVIRLWQGPLFGRDRVETVEADSAASPSEVQKADQ